MSLRPVNRIKHVVDAQFATTGAANNDQTLILTTDTPTLAVTNSVETGSKVNAIYLHLEAVNTEATQGVLPNAYMIIFKDPGGNLTPPTVNGVGASDNKKYVIHQEMVMYQPVVGGVPRSVFKGVIKIPKGYRRFGPNDSLQLIVFIPSTGTTVNMCTQTHYKEFR